MKRVVWLRVYRGKEVLKKEDGSISNENQLVKLTHDTLEWHNYLSGLKATPYCKVEVEKVLQPSEEIITKEERKGLEMVKTKSVKTNYEELEIPKDIYNEVLVAHKGNQNVVLTPEQKEIAELKALVGTLVAKAEKPKKEKEKSPKKDTKDVDEKALKKQLRAEYKVKFGKGAFNGWSADQLKEKLAEK